jgi:CheY-like chemotaxis protein
MVKKRTLADMNLTFAEFESQLNQVLHRLYDPSLRPSAAFRLVLGHSPADSLNTLQTAIIQAVEDLRPADHVPKSARSWRLYAALYYRFVSNLSQDEVAEIVSITPRHLRREQVSAINLMAKKLWTGAHLPLESSETGPDREEPGPDFPPEVVDQPNPENQLRLDLLALQESAPGIVADVPQVVRSVITMIDRYTAGKNPHKIPLSAPAELKASLHPSALRQVLWMIVRQAIEQQSETEGSIICSANNQRALIELSFAPPFNLDEQKILTIAEILEVQSGSFKITPTAGQVTFQIDLLLVDRTVLVVDDNQDIVHLYQRFLVGTPYYLVHLARGQEVLEQAHLLHPDIIVLDIMLPDIDGWDLLTRLSEVAETRDIPVIICSVVSDPELAIALGARGCLTKPVQRPEFLTALNRVANRL